MNKTLLGLFKSLFSWFLYSVLINDFHVSIVYAATIAIGVTLLLNFKYLKKGYLISWVVLINLSLALFLALFSPNTYLQKDPWLLSSLILAISAWISILIKKPFTLQYARESVPSEKWTHPTFIKINQIITLVWACVFSVSFCLHLMIMEQLFDYKLLTKLIFLASGVGIIFSIYYPKYARRRARQQSTEVML